MRDLAHRAHAGQRRWGGEPYITHPEAVAAKVAHLGPEYEAAALAHDIGEDCPDFEIPWGQFPVSVRAAVVLLTHDPNTHTYLQYLLLLATAPIARAVKLADLEHNLSTADPKRNKGPVTKWQLAKHILENLT